MVAKPEPVIAWCDLYRIAPNLKAKVECKIWERLQPLLTMLEGTCIGFHVGLVKPILTRDPAWENPLKSSMGANRSPPAQKAALRVTPLGVLGAAQDSQRRLRNLAEGVEEEDEEDQDAGRAENVSGLRTSTKPQM